MIPPNVTPAAVAGPDPSSSLDGVLGDIGATFDHAAIAARRIRDLLPLWQDTLQGRFAIGADNPEIGWRTVRLEFGDAWVIELIEPLGESTFFDKFFQRNPAGGVHHLTFLVDDVPAVNARLAEAGYRPFGLDPAGYPQCFVHPRDANGVLIQFMAREVGRRTETSMSLDDVLSGRGHNGTGLASP